MSSEKTQSPDEKALQAFVGEMASCLLLDRRSISKQIETVRKRVIKKQPVDRALEKLHGKIERSRRIYEARASIPYRLHYPEDLPVSQKHNDIAEAINRSQVVIVAGETGSGKTTQIPKICLQLGRGVAGRIGHTQPRRIAARSVAQRIAEECSTEMGGVVGYQVRFHDQVKPETRVKLMTDGILLAEIQSDRDLLQYDTLIIDEAHERSLNIDFILGYLSQLLKRRPDLKLIITSATIATDKFSRHFDNAPVVEVSGRSYPVEVLYRPLYSDDPDEQDLQLKEGILSAIDEVTRRERGDVLVFLSGEREIRDVAEALRKHHPPDTEILPLFSRLSVAEQNRIFQAHARLRIVLATNVAETSLTVPGIKYVIDPGTARISRYSYRSKVQRLPIEKISQASANQRKGRCGRVSAGVCVRLYDEDDFNLRNEFTEPEIQRTNLASVILNMKLLGLGDVDKFPFIDAPDQRFINDGYRLLFELAAVDEKRQLTRLGREMARLPVDPRLARMLLQARDESCLQEMLVIVCALTIQDPRERPLDAQQKADEAHREFQDETSDFNVLLNIWDYFLKKKKQLSNNKLRKHCHERFLAYRRLHEWFELHLQLQHQIKEMGMRPNSSPSGQDAINRSLLSGLISHVGFNIEQSEYQGSHGKKFMIFPGSGVFKKRPKWIMAAEIVETSRLYARTVSAIKPEWLEQVARHLLKHSYSEPYWQARAGQVAAKEKVTLYGLVVVSNRKVNYGRIDPHVSREIMIRSALVQGDFKTRAGFFHRNRTLIEQVENLEDKARRRDIQADEQSLYDFYDSKIPATVYSQAAFEKWWRKKEKQQADFLDISLQQLIRDDAALEQEQTYPDVLMCKALPVALSYHFAPGKTDDGVTAHIPLAILNQLDAGCFDWLVPGLLEEKVVGLIKGLPKSLRRNFVPAPEYARACLSVLDQSGGPLLQQLTQHLKRMTGKEVPVKEWQIEKLPLHLQMNFQVLDDQEQAIATGRDLAALQRELQGQARASFSKQLQTTQEHETNLPQDITTWDFGDLSEFLELERHGVKLKAYPALLEQGGKLSVVNMDQAEQAEQASRQGLVSLFMRMHQKDMSYLDKNIQGIDKLCVLYSPLGQCEELKGDIKRLAIYTALGLADGLIRTEAEFQQRGKAATKILPSVANDIATLLLTILNQYKIVRKHINGKLNPAWLKSLSDIKSQLEQLVPARFLQQLSLEQLRHMPRYLQAIELRLEKLDKNLQRDMKLMHEINVFDKQLKAYVDGHPDTYYKNAGFIRFRWMLEEFRVSLFAQELKTAYPVSAKRLKIAWEEIQAQ